MFDQDRLDILVFTATLTTGRIMLACYIQQLYQTRLAKLDDAAILHVV